MISLGHSDSIEIKCNLQVENTDECSIGSHNCDSNASCTDQDNGFTCSCNQGYIGDGISCDYDECIAEVDDCSPNAFCNNTMGGFTCTCQNGYTGNGTSCNNVDECTEASTCGQDDMCVDTIGSYTCESCEIGEFEILD